MSSNPTNAKPATIAILVGGSPCEIVGSGGRTLFDASTALITCGSYLAFPWAVSITTPDLEILLKVLLPTLREADIRATSPDELILTALSLLAEQNNVPARGTIVDHAALQMREIPWSYFIINIGPRQIAFAIKAPAELMDYLPAPSESGLTEAVYTGAQMLDQSEIAGSPSSSSYHPYIEWSSSYAAHQLSTLEPGDLIAPEDLRVPEANLVFSEKLEAACRFDDGQFVLTEAPRWRSSSHAVDQDASKVRVISAVSLVPQNSSSSLSEGLAVARPLGAPESVVLVVGEFQVGTGTIVRYDGAQAIVISSFQRNRSR